MYLSHLNSLRAIAILLIVAGHSIGFFSWEEYPYTRNALEDWAANGAVIFIFISGYLFQHLSATFTYSGYLLKKIKYVLIPYLIVSIPAIGYAVFFKEPAIQYSFLEGTSRAYQILWFYLHGGAHINYPLWFIPVIFGYYLAAPVFLIVTRYPILYWLLLFLLPISLLAHRPDFPNPDTIHSLIYFLSAYILGMFASQFRDKIDFCLEKYLGALFFIVVAYYLIHLSVADYHGNYHVKHIFSSEKGYIDWLYLHKILLVFLLLGTLKKYDSFMAEKVRYIGAASFSVYFLHAYILYAFHLAVRWRPFEGGLIRWFLLVASVVIISLGLTRLIQKVFGKTSRLLIGS